MTSPIPTLGDFRAFTKGLPDSLPLHATLWAGPPIAVHGVSDERFGQGEDITAVVIQVHLKSQEQNTNFTPTLQQGARVDSQRTMEGFGTKPTGVELEAGDF